MTDLPLDYHDYHRTIVAFHGTTAEIAGDLVDGQPFQVSSNSDDWLGSGAYFWEYAPKQAWWWAREFKRFPRPAVVGAMIRLEELLRPPRSDERAVTESRPSRYAGEVGCERFEGPEERQSAQEPGLRGLQ